MFISEALAQGTGGGGGSDPLIGFLPIVLIFVVFWFLLIRPQQKRMKEHKAKVSDMARGDTVVTGGGIIGKITKIVSDTEAQVEIAEGIRVKVLRSSVQDVVKPGGSVKDEEPPAKKGKKAEKPANDEK